MVGVRKIVVVLCTWLLCGAYVDYGFASSDAPSGGPHMRLPSDSFVGVVLYPDGSTPVPDLDVHVWSVEKERFVYRTRTNSDGGFEVPWIREGRAYIMVGSVKVDLQVIAPVVGESGQQHDIVVVVPRKMIIGSAGPRLVHVLAAPVLMSTPLLPSLISP